MLSATCTKAARLIPSTVRSYASSTTATNIQHSTAKSGVKIASVDDQSPTAGLAVVVNAGPRFENADQGGVAHHLKNFTFKNTGSRTAFRIAREAELQGATLSSALTREQLIISAEFLKSDLPYFVDLLNDVVANTKYQAHEFVEVAHNVHDETAYTKSTPEIAALEAAHQLAFHQGLGHSLFASSTSHVNVDAVKNYAKSVFHSGNVAIVGSGISHDELTKVVESNFQLASGSAPVPQSSQYYGGETRIESATGKPHFLLAFNGAALNSEEYAAAQVFRYVLGGEQYIKWSKGTSILSQAATKFSHGTEISAFNLGYSDAGLFGIQVSGGSDIDQAVNAAVEALQAAAKNVSQEDFKMAVAKAKFGIAAGLESRADRFVTLGQQALGASQTSALDISVALDNLKVDAVKKVAKTILSSKPTAVAYGNVNKLPYLSSLSL